MNSQLFYCWRLPTGIHICRPIIFVYLKTLQLLKLRLEKPHSPAQTTSGNKRKSWGKSACQYRMLVTYQSFELMQLSWNFNTCFSQFIAFWSKSQESRSISKWWTDNSAITAKAMLLYVASCCTCLLKCVSKSFKPLFFFLVTCFLCGFKGIYNGIQ